VAAALQTWSAGGGGDEDLEHRRCCRPGPATTLQTWSAGGGADEDLEHRETTDDDSRTASDDLMMCSELFA
jgi:hypothetical protein